MGAKSEEVFGDVWMEWGKCGRSQRFINGEVRKVLMDVVWKEVRGEWKKEAQRRPKLDIIGRSIEKECEGRCMMVKCKRRRRWLMKLRGGTAELGVETRRWHMV